MSWHRAYDSSLLKRMCTKNVLVLTSRLLLVYPTTNWLYGTPSKIDKNHNKSFKPKDRFNLLPCNFTLPPDSSSIEAPYNSDPKKWQITKQFLNFKLHIMAPTYKKWPAWVNKWALNSLLFIYSCSTTETTWDHLQPRIPDNTALTRLEPYKLQSTLRVHTPTPPPIYNYLQQIQKF